MRIVLCYPVTPELVSRIRSVAPDADIIDAGQERVAEALPDADIFCGHAKVPVPWDEIVGRGRLKWIQSSAAGLDHCLVPAVRRSPIVVSSASGLFADPVAEQTFALLLGLIRRLPVFFREAAERRFERLPTDDLHGKTVGIVGLGGNGRRIAECLAPWKTRIIATDWFPVDRPPHVDRLWPADQLDRLLVESDIVILCVPLNDQTRHMIGPGELRRMRAGALLINVARGPVVDEPALVAALVEGHLGGAGLDVTEIEPLPPESRLWELPQVLITPHVGAQSANRNRDVTEFFCENLQRFQAGRPLLNEVDKDLGFPRRG